ncbi:P2Y purinoceptor 14-like [Pimephales promelas]|uniref:P2Y purinoceptor 14-like n=1 Tax=Pimephales promelas TaxID=90988 RepID=UPI001955E9B6|nr:P2Y purinoceptor 14-like [Pimephales promelas]KAG1932841.1 P2Y purinoceptor 14 isoform a [Pimephales promelas]
MDQNTTNSTEGPCGLSEMPARTFFISVYSLVFLASLALNSIAIYVYFCKSTSQSSITIYLKNLVIADFFVCLCLILRIVKYASTSVEIQRIYCIFGAPASYLNMYSSILFMGYIAANRYMRIVRPLETRMLQTVRSTRYICIVTWTFLLCFNVVYIAVFFGSVFLSVLVSLILFYWGNVQRLRQAQRTMPENPGDTKLSKSKRNMRVLVAVFCVCFVPYHMVRLPHVFISPLLHDCTTAQAFYIIKELTVLLAVLNACLDPLIYFFFCKTFRARLNLQRFQQRNQ